MVVQIFNFKEFRVNVMDFLRVGGFSRNPSTKYCETQDYIVV